MKPLNQLFSSASPVFLLENTREAESVESAMVFTDPIREIRAHNRKELIKALSNIDKLRRSGLFLAGYLHYEAALFLIKKLSPLSQQSSKEPVLRFYAFDRPTRYSRDEVDNALNTTAESAPFIRDLRPDESKEAYLNNIKAIQHYIYEGDTYQVNHTLRLHFELEGKVAGLYRALRLRQRVAFSAWLKLDDQDILSLSPELFIEKHGTLLKTQPMKGTAPRGQTKQEDERIRQTMEKDEKQLSENLMIVDLMRNDIGRLAKPGTMKAEELFQIQTYQTLFQMISTISGEVDEDIEFASVLEGLFPCGSITGAPKIRTMEIIDELETSKRGIYTGAIGYITPDNDFSFSVPIRTLQLTKERRGILGVGGGIIHESKAEEEWRESMLKAQFLTGLNTDFSLIETMYFDGAATKPERLKMHLDRMENSARVFAFPFDRDKIEHTVVCCTKTLEQNSLYKIRLTLDSCGQMKTEASEITSNPDSELKVCISPLKIHSDSLFRQHKTTRREYYNLEYDRVHAKGFYDIVFLNENNRVAEASRHNLMIEKQGRLLTPPLSEGALPGIMRQLLLKDPVKNVTEIPITLEDLMQADRVFLSNSVRGLVEVLLE